MSISSDKSINSIIPFNKDYIDQLEKAILQNCKDKIHSLVRHIPNFDTQEDKVLALHTLASHGKRDGVYQLLCQFTPFNSLFKGQSLLHHAIESGDNETIKLILVLELNINSQNSEGKTPLHLAAEKANTTAIYYLLARGANPNLQDSIGDTPLHKAVLSREINSIEALLKSDHLDLKVKNKNGLTPYQMAINNLFFQAVEKLNYPNSHINSAEQASRVFFQEAPAIPLEDFDDSDEDFLPEANQISSAKTVQKNTQIVGKKRPISERQKENRDPKCKKLETLFIAAKSLILTKKQIKKLFLKISNINYKIDLETFKDQTSIIYPDRKDCKTHPLSKLFRAVIVNNNKSILEYFTEQFDTSELLVSEMTPICYSITRKKDISTEFLLNKKISNVNFQNRIGDTALHLLLKSPVHSSTCDFIEKLFNKNRSAKADIENFCGVTAIDLAAKSDNPKIRSLVAMFKRRAPLRYSGKKKPQTVSARSVKMNMRASGNLDDPSEIHRMLIKAAVNNNLDKIKSLFNKLYENNNDNEKFPIHNLISAAIINNNEEALEFFISNFDLKNMKGPSMILDSLQVRRYSATKLLVEKTDIDVNSKNQAGNTVLHILLNRKINPITLEIISKILEKSNCDITIRNRKNITVKELIENSNNNELKRLLEIYQNKKLVKN